VNTTQRTQEVTHCRPHPFGSVDVYFANAIAVIVACPFFLAVTNRRVRANNVVVALPFVGEYHGIGPGERMDMVNQCFFVRVMNHSQAYLSTLATNCADNRWSIIVVGAMASSFVGPSSGWIIGIVVTFTFFPPRSETSRPFQSVCLAKDLVVGGVPRCLGSPSAYREPFDGSLQSPVQWSLSVRPCIPHAATKPLALAGSASPRTLSHRTDCRCPDKDIGTPSSGFSWLCGTHVPPPRAFRSVGTSIRSGESTLAAKLRSNHHPAGLLLESPCWRLYHIPSTCSRHEPRSFMLVLYLFPAL